MRRTMCALALGATVCSCAPGTGTVNVTLWGEDFITTEIPPVSGTMAGFENGWTLRYTKFLVNVGAFAVADNATTDPAALIPGFRVFDLHTINGPATFGSLASLAAQRWNHVAYEIVPATVTSTAGNATAADVTLMATQGYSVYLEADVTSATAGAYHIAWGFTSNTRYEECRDAANQPGVVVPTGSAAAAQITVHGDHLFYDDLQSPEARVRFDAIAGADADADRTVTLDELAAVDLTRLPAGQYGTGSAPNVNTLRDFVAALVATIGHFDGEGHCEERRR